MVRDELAGWFGSFDRYTQGKGGDVARWLEMFGGRSMIVDRKSGKPKTIYVERAAVSVVGGIQPGTLRRSLGEQHRENGLAARLMLAYPPRRPKRWTEAEIGLETEAAVEAVFQRLYQLQPEVDDNGHPRPMIVSMTPEAKREWIRFYNEHGQEQAGLSGDLSAAWSKLEGGAARLALVIHYARWAGSCDWAADAGPVDAEAIGAGVALSRWFGNEARRVYSRLAEDEDQQEQRELIELIERQPGRETTVRELQRTVPEYRNSAEDAEKALTRLAEVGLGSWIVNETAGRPATVFRLDMPATCDRSIEIPEETDLLSQEPHDNGDINRLFNDAAAEDGPEYE